MKAAKICRDEDSPFSDELSGEICSWRVGKLLEEHICWTARILFPA